MKRIFVLLVLLLTAKLQVFATHVRAGEFSYTYVGGNTFRVQIRTYTEICNGSKAADQDRLPFSWGDGTPIDTIFRTQIISIGTSAAPQCDYCIQENIYEGNHTYSGFGVFKLSLQDVNRVAGINNFNEGLSDQIPLYVEDSLYFLDPSQYGPVNNSPILDSKGVDFAHEFSTFSHFPNAFDPDGDSLAFEIYVPLQQPGFPVSNFVMPDSVLPLQGPSSFTIDPLTGTITWNSPYYIGAANIGIKIHEYRKRYEGGVPKYFLMGMMMRDLQILICPPLDHVPVLTVHDICVIAGTHIQLHIGARDPDFGPIVITASGGPYEITESPATSPLAQTEIHTDSTNAIFDWQTVCDHSDNNPYIVVVKATDNYDINNPTSALASFKIKVVAPPPQNLTANPHGNSVILNWDNPYACDSTKASRFMGFSVWRREGSNNFAIDTCTPGLDGRGYVEIASGVRAYTYTDNNLQIGKDYCYRVLGEFGTTTSLGYVVHFVRSLPSNEACTQLKKDVPVIIKASVNTTDPANGSVAVAWLNPDPLVLDTLVQHHGPYKYEVYHSPDFNATTPTLIHSFTSPSFKGLTADSTYTDTLIDTKDSVHSYIIKFYADTLVGQTQNASTIFLTIAAAGKQLTLSWSENVPWNNHRYVIYRRQNHTTGIFDSISTTTAQTYIDKGLKNDSTYCYVIKSVGHYSATGLGDSLINFSQENCAVPIDTVGPCPPLLAVHNICTDGGFSGGPFTNLLTWGKPATSCGGDAIKYYIYYSPDPNTALTLIDSSHLVNDTTFLHTLNNTVAGCYAIAAVDSYYNQGAKSPIICVDNCPEYNLPNTFTPNGDGHNDAYVPLTPYRFIDKVAMKIYTSWGTLIFETSDPALNWNGKIASTGKDAPDGTYYYVCEVYETRLGNDESKPTRTLSGFIHLYR